MKNRRAWTGALLALLVAAMSSSTSLAEGWPDDPLLKLVYEPLDTSCIRPDFPFYSARTPIIYQQITHEGQIELVGFGYTDACLSRTAPAQRHQRSWGTTLVQEGPDVWKPDIVNLARNLATKPILQALPRLAEPGNNAMARPLADLPVHWKAFYDESKDHPDCWEPSFRTQDKVCPGIPREFAEQVLEPAGYIRTQDRFGRYHWWNGGADSWGEWMQPAPPKDTTEHFYLRQVAHAMRQNPRVEEYLGGLFRILLHPVDLVTTSVPAEVVLDDQGNAVVPLTIINRSSRNRLMTTIGWRRSQETAWNAVTAWRYAGEAEWFTPSEEVGPLTSMAFNRSAGMLEGAGETRLEVLIAGLEPDATVELMVNPLGGRPNWRGIAEATAVKPSHPVTNAEREAAIRGELTEGWTAFDAYANNVASTTVKAKATPSTVDLEVVRVTAPASQAYSPGGTYTVTWTIRNNSAVTVRAIRTVSFASTLAGAVPGPVATITLGPNESLTETYEKVPVFGCGDKTQATVTLAAAAGFVETDRSNNGKSVVTNVTGSCPGGGHGGGDTGYTVIIPADCIPNPDPASNKPCTNYDLTVPNRR